ncbi:site-2 protease family protein [Actinocorallia sp. A-T 12471]|uniref:site-2 protease family protein n=1 Tax=Actinocorallia sp. A-T 12471 TaxID=3089813 RepID=UPI0029D3DE68|nr:site-2 protease family protein [Actinocorallia sp. A-T 12471]MDX6743719.1 site-2 protease family protein [Actinocorallia sp. A-T 12471]
MRQTQRGSGRGISPVFLGIVAFTVVCGLLVWWSAWEPGVGPSSQAGLAVFGFVLGAWVVSLCLHEFGHAALAHRFGDRSVAARGYLTLDPLKYTDMTLSIVLPVLFLMLGGIGLPGGAVWIDRGAIQGRLRHSMVSFAGPLTNIVFALLCGAAIHQWAGPDHAVFWVALAFLGFLQITAAVLNLLPVPGLDGFGIWEPYLPRAFVNKVAPYGMWVFIGLIALLWIPPLNRAFFSVIYAITGLFGIPRDFAQVGHSVFMFW